MAGKKIPEVEKSKPKKFDPSKLSVEELENAVEYYLGYHPRFFIYEGGFAIKINVSKIQAERRRGKDIKMEGLRPHLKELNRKHAV